MKRIPGTGLELNLDTPETPKLVNPLNGATQRATMTDVLLVTIIEKLDDLHHQLELMHRGRNEDDNQAVALLGDIKEAVSTSGPSTSKTSSRKRSSRTEADE